MIAKGLKRLGNSILPSQQQQQQSIGFPDGEGYILLDEREEIEGFEKEEEAEREGERAHHQEEKENQNAGEFGGKTAAKGGGSLEEDDADDIDITEWDIASLGKRPNSSR